MVLKSIRSQSGEDRKARWSHSYIAFEAPNRAIILGAKSRLARFSFWSMAGARLHLAIFSENQCAMCLVKLLVVVLLQCYLCNAHPMHFMLRVGSVRYRQRGARSLSEYRGRSVAQTSQTLACSVGLWLQFGTTNFIQRDFRFNSCCRRMREISRHMGMAIRMFSLMK